MKKWLVLAATISVTIITSGCDTISGFGSDNTPAPTSLTNFKPALSIKQVWSASSGSGSRGQTYKFAPVYSNGLIYVANNSGSVAAFDAATGRTAWQTNTGLTLTAGPAVNQNVVVIGDISGNIQALQAGNGQRLWQARVSNEMLAAPVIANNKVIIKTIDGKVYALDIQNGQQVWVYDHGITNFILRGSSSPQVINNMVIAGFADGKLNALNLQNGQLLWQCIIASPQGPSEVEQLADIDANPVIAGNRLYASAYQGNLVALSLDGQQQYWSQPLSTYNSFAVNNDKIVIGDIESNLYAFDRATGKQLWVQKQLYARQISAPAIQGNTVIVGDKEGYVHWLSLSNGQFLARAQVGGGGIVTAPVVVGNTVYVANAGGTIVAYRIN